MKYFFDTEFLERPYTIDLVSIGIVDENGCEFYAESSEVDWSQANPWVLENVKPHLQGGEYLLSRENIASILLDYAPPEIKPEFWAYCGAYDWVAFCWLFGAMIDLPRGYPTYCHDLKQLCDSLGNPQLPKQEGIEHNALADAKWNKQAYEYLASVTL